MIQPTHQQPEADDEISDDSEDELSFVIFGPSRFDWVSTQYVYMCI